MTAPLFSDEGPQYYDAAFKHNAPFAKPGPYLTTLTPDNEKKFRTWVATNRVPFDPSATVADYDMRGYWLATGGQWRGGHFPDTYKTPYDTTFSKESLYATPNCPFEWDGDYLIDRRDSSVVFAPPGSPARAKPSSYSGPGNFYVQHADGTLTPIPLVHVGGNHWAAPEEVPLAPGEKIISRST